MAQTLSNRYSAASFPGLSPELIGALVVSIALHAYLITLRVGFPDMSRSLSAPQMLEVVLVNSKSGKRPEKAQVQAQANLEGGGNVDDDRRAKTPMPVSKQHDEGDDLQRAQRRVQELQAQQQQLQQEQSKAGEKQRELLTTSRGKKAIAVSPGSSDTPEETQAPQLSGTELRDAALLSIPLEAEINRRIEEYNKKPRRKFLGVNAEEARYALYMDQWRQKVEKIGTLNYPDSARGRIYGSLRVTVIVKADGTVNSVEVDRSSGHAVLDKAVKKIVDLAAPFAAFPPDIRREYDELVIVRTWTFAPGDKVFSD